MSPEDAVESLRKAFQLEDEEDVPIRRSEIMKIQDEDIFVRKKGLNILFDSAYREGLVISENPGFCS
jgi:hypothetical protein